MRLATLVLGLGLAAAPQVSAQPRLDGGVDLGYTPSYVWRGIVLADRPALALAPFASAAAGRHALAAGAWTGWQAGTAPPDARSLRASGSGGLLEADLWAQYTLHAAGTDVSVGGIRSLFPGRPGADHTEAYVQVRPASPWRPLELGATVFVEVEREEAAYAELEASWSFSLLPLPMGPPTVVLGATAGYSLAAPDEVPPGRIAFAEEGLAHLDLAFTLVLPFDPLTVRLGLHHQHGLDPAARVAPGGEPFARTWGEATVSYAFNPPGRP